MSDQSFRIVFAIFPRLTQLDFTGPFEVLSRLTGAEVVVASREGGGVASDTGLEFGSTRMLAGVERCDLLCVPGGPGVEAASVDREFLEQIARLAEGARYVTSVCNGSLLLGAAGLLRGKRAACHWAWRDLLPLFGAVPDGARVVRDGRVVTGGGVTAGIDFALTLAADIAGEQVARAIQLSIEYAPAPPFDSGRPETAGAALVEFVSPRFAERKARFAALHG
ncbi:thiamine biosynthesis protein ThiJ [Methylosinus sp. R-45379]|uniref:DJ-1/PfpI family protein n=1 Tax=Methylosinus sp. R-45379 TaxID=980563 RepID=UPI0007C94C99|nr:DJ-1/PfpI family protein [Methylosinus sp. R-45379]OAI25210.1 thiamine biosynthesis protein ThiJ [Methylosinus sp. R-45379]